MGFLDAGCLTSFVWTRLNKDMEPDLISWLHTIPFGNPFWRCRLNPRFGWVVTCRYHFLAPQHLKKTTKIGWAPAQQQLENNFNIWIVYLSIDQSIWINWKYLNLSIQYFHRISSPTCAENQDRIWHQPHLSHPGCWIGDLPVWRR